MSSDSSLEKFLRSFDVWYFVVLSSVWRLFAIFCGQILFFVGIICSCILFCLCGSVASVFGRVRSPCGSLLCSSSRLSPWGVGRGGGFFLSLRFLPCVLRSRNLRRYRRELACCALFPPPSSPSLRSSPPSPSSRPASPLSRCLSVCLSLFSLFSSFASALPLSNLELVNGSSKVFVWEISSFHYWNEELFWSESGFETRSSDQMGPWRMC